MNEMLLEQNAQYRQNRTSQANLGISGQQIQQQVPVGVPTVAVAQVIYAELHRKKILKSYLTLGRQTKQLTASDKKRLKISLRTSANFTPRHKWVQAVQFIPPLLALCLCV